MKNIWKMTVSLNIVASLVAIWNLLRCNFGAGPDVAAVILIGVVVFGLLLGPYFLLSLLAVVLRQNRVLSIVLFVLVIMTAVGFLSGQIIETNLYQAHQQLNHTVRGQRMGNFLLYIGQWAVSLSFSIVLFVIWLFKTALTKNKPMAETPAE